MRRIILLLTACLISAMSFAEIINSGNVNENITWTLNDEGTLTISGTGDMTNYHSTMINQPWYNGGMRDRISNIVIEEGITSVGSYAFRHCYALTSIKIPNTVISIMDGAFQGCSTLQEIGIPNSVQTIGNYVVNECYDLEKIFVNWDTPIEINPQIFSDKYRYIFIVPQNTKEIYLQTDVWKEYIIKEENESIGGTDGNVNWSLDDEGRLTISGLGNMNSYTYYDCAPWYSYRSSIKKVTIEKGITSCGDCSFYNCRNLVEITIPNSVENIGSMSFESCVNLVDLELPNSVTRIDTFAFVGCKKLSTIKIPNSVTYISGAAFSGCNSLQTVIVDWETPLKLNGYPFGGIDIGGVIISMSEIKLFVPIGTKALYEQASVWKEFQIIEQHPDNIIASGDVNENITWTLNSDSTLTISGEGEMPNYSQNWQTGETNTPWEIYKDNIVGVIIQEGITYIGNYLCHSCTNLGKITIPSTVELIQTYTFDIVNNVLNFIDVNENNPNYHSENGILFNKEKTELIKYPQAKEDNYYSIPNSVEFISLYAFYNCNNLIEISIPNSVTYLAGLSFGNNLERMIVNWEDPICHFTHPYFNQQPECVLIVPANTKELYQACFQWENFQIIEKITTSLTDIKEKSAVNVYSAHKTIFVENAQSEHIAVYNTQGQLIASERNVNGTFKTIVPQAGVYIVRVGGEVVKAAVVN